MADAPPTARWRSVSGEPMKIWTDVISGFNGTTLANVYRLGGNRNAT